ncbi:hypothetical protein H8959_008854 [Pygathrix nigripes]
MDQCFVGSLHPVELTHTKANCGAQGEEKVLNSASGQGHGDPACRRGVCQDEGQRGLTLLQDLIKTGCSALSPHGKNPGCRWPIWHRMDGAKGGLNVLWAGATETLSPASPQPGPWDAQLALTPGQGWARCTQGWSGTMGSCGDR